jgi:hypothetical protein
MHTPDRAGHEPDKNGREPEKIDTSLGFERKDVRVRGVVIFLLGLGVFVAVVSIVAFGLGKGLNRFLAREQKADYGPANRWSKQPDVRPLGNMPDNPSLQGKLETLTQNLPAPKVQSDDGLQDTADLHAREDLLISGYTWAGDGPNGEKRVRIPIERAMELVAQRGLPVSPAFAHSPRLTGEPDPAAIAAPLTTGFVRTAYEQKLAAEKQSPGQEKK